MREHNRVSSDWERAEQRNEPLNWQQQVAKKTRGYVTIPNILSVMGVLLEMSSHDDISQGNWKKGILKSGLASLCDLEGAWARKYGVSSEIGAAFDRRADALKAASRLVMFTENSIAPKSHIVAIAAPKIIAGVQSMIAINKHKEDLQTEQVAKFAEGLRDAAVGLSLIEKAAESRMPKASRVAKKIGSVTVGLACLTGVAANLAYQRQLSNRNKKSRS